MVMKTRKRNFIIAALLMIFSLSAAVEMSAQVPSVPQRSSKSKSSKSDRTVWGTQYDWLSTRYITLDDIRRYDSGQIRVLRNSIYARHGRYFKDARLSEYFYTQSWYNPYRKEVPQSELNKYEKANIQFLKKHE